MATVAPFPMKPDDPREQPVVSSQGYYSQFQRELATSEDIRVAAAYLGHLHFKFEGWGDFHAQPRPELLKKYQKAMELAVRYCSEVYRSGADSRAADYAENKLEMLLEQLRSCDVTREDQGQVMRAFAAEIMDVFIHHLAIGCGRHKHEWALFYAEEAKDGIEYTEEERDDHGLIFRTTGE